MGSGVGELESDAIQGWRLFLICCTFEEKQDRWADVSAPESHYSQTVPLFTLSSAVHADCMHRPQSDRLGKINV